MGSDMEKTAYEALAEEFPAADHPGMAALEWMVSEFHKGIDTGNKRNVNLFHTEIDGFIWGMYAAGMIDEKRRDLLTDEFSKEAGRKGT